MKKELKQLESNSPVTTEFAKVIAQRCIEIVEKFDSNYAVKMIKKEFNIEDKK